MTDFMCRITESQGAGTRGQGRAPKRPLQLQSHHPGTAGLHLYHLQLDPASCSQERHHCVGAQDGAVASDRAAGDRIDVVADGGPDHVQPLQGQEKAGEEGRGILHLLRHRLLQLQHHHLGCGRGADLGEQEEVGRQGRVGLELQGRQAQGVVPGQGQLRAGLSHAGESKLLRRKFSFQSY